MSHNQRRAIITETGAGKYQNLVKIGEHSLVISEPAELGGDNSGPTPVEVLNAALGACTSITLRMYADRKGWPLEGVTVEVSHKRGQLEECEQQTGTSGARMQDIFTKEITLAGPLDTAQRKRLLEIAEKCPVHRVLKRNACMISGITA